MILRLDPSIPVQTPLGKARAFIMLDYSEDHNLMWVCAIDATGAIWTFSNPEIRIQSNQTLNTQCEFSSKPLDNQNKPV